MPGGYKARDASPGHLDKCQGHCWVPSTHRAEHKGGPLLLSVERMKECLQPPFWRKEDPGTTSGSSEGTHTHTQQCTSPGGAIFTLAWGWGLISKNKEKLIWPGDLSQCLPWPTPSNPNTTSPPWPSNPETSSGDRKLGDPVWHPWTHRHPKSGRHPSLPSPRSYSAVLPGVGTSLAGPRSSWAHGVGLAIFCFVFGNLIIYCHLHEC